MDNKLLKDAMKAKQKELITQQKSEEASEAAYQFYGDCGWKSLMGNTWANLFVVIGGRQTGKSYAGTEFLIKQWRERGRRFVWIRLSKISVDKMLANNCDQLFDPDLMRKYKLDLVRSKSNVYEVLKRDEKGKVVKKKLMGRVLALSEMAKEKGVAFFDKDYKGWTNIFVDEFVREQREKDTFDVSYNLANTIENLIRNKHEKVRVIMFCNYCSDISDVLSNLDFLPLTFGRYKLKRKRTIIDYLPVSEGYKKMREGAIANLILGDDSGNFSNKSNRNFDRIMTTDTGMLRPVALIKFSREQNEWFVLYEKNVIKRYKKQQVKAIIPMRPYIDEVFIPDKRDLLFQLYDAKALWFGDMLTAVCFEKCLKDLRPRG